MLCIGYTCRLILQILKTSDRNIAILGLVMSIVSCGLLADWQSLSHDKCIELSPFHNPGLTIRNRSELSQMTYAVPQKFSNEPPKSPATTLNCISGQNHEYIECMLEQELSETYHSYFNYNCTVLTNESHYKCIQTRNKYDNNLDAVGKIQTLRLLNNTLYYKMMIQCETAVFKGHNCHWIPNSIITHQYCHDCQPICRNPEYSLNFIQFSLGAAILMLSIPVAWIPVASMVSQRIKGEMQVYYTFLCNNNISIM